MSQNRVYSLTISKSGELRVHRHDADEKPIPIFWSNTAVQWIGEKWAEINEKGYFEALHREHANSDKITMWSTRQWRACQQQPPDNFVSLVMLTDMGGLEILHVSSELLFKYNDEGFIDRKSWQEDNQQRYISCEVFAGDSQRIRENGAEDMGRLAVILTGTLRSYKKTCANMNRKIFDHWPGGKGVDIFVVTIDSDVWSQGGETIDWDEVRRELRDCFGGRFKGLELVEPLAEFPEIELTGKVSPMGKRLAFD